MSKLASKLGRSFAWLNATQFLGALNDNLFKLLIILHLIEVNGAKTASRTTTIVMAVFVVPFLLFSALAGKIADKISKRDIVVAAKVAEFAVMFAGFLAFYFHADLFLYVVLFMMAATSTSAWIKPRAAHSFTHRIPTARCSRFAVMTWKPVKPGVS